MFVVDFNHGIGWLRPGILREGSVGGIEGGVGWRWYFRVDYLIVCCVLYWDWSLIDGEREGCIVVEGCLWSIGVLRGSWFVLMPV